MGPHRDDEFQVQGLYAQQRCLFQLVVGRLLVDFQDEVALLERGYRHVGPRLGRYLVLLGLVVLGEGKKKWVCEWGIKNPKVTI